MPKSVAPYRITSLGKHHDRSTFACGHPALDRYLQQQARQDAEKLVAAPLVLTGPPSATVLGYYTLSAAHIEADKLPAELAKRLPRYPNLPVTLLGRLAVEQRCKGKGLGALLLVHALQNSLAAAAQIAAIAVVVDAKDEAAAAFYRRFGFIALQAEPARLFLPLKTVAKLFPEEQA